ncbi:nucleotidyltransferase domain-containing protein [Thermogladius sp. 4427co]|uniref:nucleotidyltransferase domain-containing protein n=1 Tax=Thermogladius sp. 4427co TaxID=3450718 RepID=UPI003F7B27B5
MLSWVRYHFQHLARWREYAGKVAKAARELLPGSEVFVVGSVAEGRTTIYSDIDILVVVKNTSLDNESKKKLMVEILSRAIEEHGLPWDAPVELHIVDEEGFREYVKHCRRILKAE